jgi:hypothetical protein
MDNEIGLSMANGGDGVITGDTGSGPLIGEFDAIRRRFSDRSIYETITVVIDAPMGNWNPAGGDVVTIAPTSLAVYPYPAFDWSAYAPADVRFLDVLSARWIGAPGGVTTEALFYIKSITGLGAQPIVSLNITTTAAFGFPPVTNEPLYVTILVGYPTGVGLSHTPTADCGSNSFYVNNPSVLIPPSGPVWFGYSSSLEFDYPHREVHLEYTTVPITFNMAAENLGSTSIIYLPDRTQLVGLSVLVNGLPRGILSLDASGRVITLVSDVDPGDNVLVTYRAIRPFPQWGEQMTIYFRAAAPQMARQALLGPTLTVVPKLSSKTLLALTIGSGSQDEGYPFPTAYVQTGGIYPDTVGFSGESDFSCSSNISVADFNAQTGLLNLPVYISMVANPESLAFTGGSVDVEGRSYFNAVPPGGYIPNAYAQDLSNPDRHKDIFPILAELAEDSLLGYRGQLVLILLLRYAFFDETNGVFFDPILGANSTSASVFRLKGNLLNKRNV